MTDQIALTATIADEILEQEKRKKDALAVLLNDYLSKRDQLFVERTEMGGTEAYISSVTLQWLAERVGFASELPLFRERIDKETGQVAIDNTTVDLIQQRPLDWSRQAQLAQYLAARKTHKFPAVLVVISQPWVDNPTAAEWDSNGEATKSAAVYTAMDQNERVGLLDVSDAMAIFALDGQHRLMGVRGLMELIKTGMLSKRKKDGRSEKSNPITIDYLEEQYGVKRSYIQGLASERIGIEFISAVVKGETREEARRRVRSIFVHVNRMAAPLSKGQIALLDEDDGFAIVARQVAVNHPLLANPENRVDYNSSNISERSAALTTLQTLKEMASLYLRRQFPKWPRPEKGLIPMRPEDDELENAFDQFMGLWDLIGTIPSVGELERGADTGSFRLFKHDKKPGKGHMLFRPVGQIVLAEALGQLVFEKDNDLDNIFQKLQKFDKDGGFRMDSEDSAWYMVLYDPNKKRMSIRGQTLATKLLVYLLGGGISDEEEREALRKELADARTIEVGEHEGQAMSFDGKWVSPKEIDLPSVIRI